MPSLVTPQESRKRSTRLETLIANWEQRVPELMEASKVPGVSMAIIVDGKLGWHRGFGVKDTLSAEPVDSETIFEAASMSKPVFAYVVMKLVEKGVLELDAPLTKYMPKRFVVGDPRLDLISARHVLSHSTGFPPWRSSQHPLKIDFTPGEKYGYSGEGYFYLQSVITHLTGREDRKICRGGYEADLVVCATDIADYMEANLLRPFRMHSSSYLPIKAFEKRMARPHDMEGKPMVPGEPHPTNPARYAAAGGLLTTPTDYAKFVMEVIDAKPGDAYRLTKRSRDEMIRPRIAVASTKEYTASWALGWRVARTNAGEWIGHGGDNPGFHCLAEASVVRKSGFVIMTNGDGGAGFLTKFAPGVSRDLQSLAR